jgi:hypothetical protein
MEDYNKGVHNLMGIPKSPEPDFLDEYSSGYGFLNLHVRFCECSVEVPLEN